MITLQYTLLEIEDALVKAGYGIKPEGIQADWYDTRLERDIPEGSRRTYMVYSNSGECLTSGPKFARMYGYDRMIEFFQLEIRKVILNLLTPVAP